MWIDTLTIYKYGEEYENKKKTLKLHNHLINDDSIETKKLPALIEALSDAWGCSYMQLQIQVRFVPEGTDMEDK